MADHENTLPGPLSVRSGHAGTSVCPGSLPEAAKHWRDGGTELSGHDRPANEDDYLRILQADDNRCDRCAGPASDLASFRCRTGPHRFDLDMRAAPARFRALHALVQAAARTRLGDLRG
jgi:hypothetical protein